MTPDIRDFDRLYENCIFRSNAAIETHSRVSEEFCDHHLRWHDTDINTRFCKLGTSALSLYSLSYGAELEIFPKSYKNFSLVHFSLKEGIEIQADGQRNKVPPGRAIISSPSRNINLHWSRNSEQLILRIPHQLLDEAANRLGQPSRFGTIRRMPGVMISEGGSRQWRAQLQTFALLEQQARVSEALRPWLTHLEQGIALFLLLQTDDQAPTPGHGEGSSRFDNVGSAKRRLDRLHDFARLNITRPITLDDLAGAAALSRRQLNVLCHEHLGMSPMIWLRGQRLDAVRATLLAEAGQDLSSIAMLHGFYHLGRFSAYYRARFGEFPSETRRRARSG